MTSSQVAGILGRASSRVEKPCICDNDISTIGNKSESDVVLGEQLVTEEIYLEENREHRLAHTFFRIPKFFQAILTLIICAILLSTTLCLIGRIRQRCSKKKQNEQEQRVPESPVQIQISSAEDGSPSATTSNQMNTTDCENPSSNHLRVVKFVRRLSGPFGDDKIDFVKESYKKLPKTKSKEHSVDDLVRPHST